MNEIIDTGSHAIPDDGTEIRTCYECSPGGGLPGWTGLVLVDAEKPTDDGEAWYERWTCGNSSCAFNHEDRLGPDEEDPDTAPGGHDFRAEQEWI